MSRSIGIFPRRGHILDANTVIVGYVGAGPRGRAAETRTGAARLLETLLNAQLQFKATIYGHSAAATGGYLLQVGHVPAGGVLADVAGWSTAAILSASGISMDEAVLSGASLHKAARTRAITAMAVSASVLNTNVVTLTVAAGHGYLVGDVVTVSGFTSAGVPMNGTYTLTAVTSTSISYAKTNANIADGGTAGVIYPGPRQILSTEEIRVAAVRAIAGTGSNGAAAPSAAGTITLVLEPSASF